MVQIDMPLPKDCRTCRFRDPDYNYCYAEEDGRIACAAGRREDWCPLKETISGPQRIRLKKSAGIPCIVDLPFKDCSRCVKFSPRMIHDTLYDRMRTLISCENRLRRRYQRKLSSVTRITAVLTGMPRGTGNHSRVEDGAIELAEVEDAYREILDELKSMRAELEQLLPSLDNPDDIAVMRLRYIDGHDVKAIPAAVCLSERAMFYHLSSAEKKLIRMFPDNICDLKTRLH